MINEGWPPADPSFSAIVWLAFTSPEHAKSPFTNTLLQVWDDGNGTASRFRQANWSAFPEAPQLISKATYFWPGKQVHPSGRVSDINLRDVADLTAPAATYHVSATTNLGHLAFPLQFLLTRYLANPPTGSGHTVSSTIAGSLFSVALLPDQYKAESLLPTPTFVTDYRTSPDNPQSPPATYLLSEPTIPETNPQMRSLMTNSGSPDSAERSPH